MPSQAAMQTRFISLFLVLICLLAACQPGGTASSPVSSPLSGTVNEEISLAPGQSVAVTGTDLTATFHTVVSDERCPSDIECAASGPVTISLSVQQGQGAATDFTLQTFTEQNGRSPNVQFEGVTNRAEVGGYTIQVISVTPYPKNLTTNIEPSEYRIGLLVSNQ
jgi:hypothetical protein